MLSTFVIVNKGKQITNDLVTVRQYANWFRSYFDEYTVKEELYIKTNAINKSTYQYHPGTKIGHWFDHKKNLMPPFVSIYINQDSACFKRLEKLGLAEKGDVANKEVNRQKGWWLRVYTVHQIELYIKSNIDKQFKISSVVDIPTQIKVKDISGVELADIFKQRKSLF